MEQDYAEKMRELELQYEQEKQNKTQLEQELVSHDQR